MILLMVIDRWCIHEIVLPTTFQKVRYVLKLRDVVLSKSTVLNEQRKHMVELATGMSWVERGQLLIDHSPCGCLLRCVLHTRDWLTTEPMKTFQLSERDRNDSIGRCYDTHCL